MGDMMTFPNTVEEFMEQYKIVDTEKIYTNGADLIPIFRMMQWFEHVSATDKNVGINDTISRRQAIEALGEQPLAWEHGEYEEGLIAKWESDVEAIKDLPPAQPKQRTGKWIPQDHNKRAGNISTCVYYYPICSECGQVGNETYKYCPHCGAKMISEGKTCDCYSDGRCIGTKEIDPCSCGGDKSKCDFYDYVRGGANNG